LYNSKEPIIIYPGCVTFTHNTLFSYIDLIRKSFNRKKIKVFVFTWNAEFNNDYADKLKVMLRSDPNIDMNFIQEYYSNPNFINYINSIKEGQLTHTPFIKKFLIFYSISRLIEEIGKYNKNSVIFKVRSGYDFRVKNFHSNFLDDIRFNYEDLKFYIDRESFHKTNPDDIFWCNRMNKSGLSEVIWNTSYDTASKIFGPDTKTLASNFKKIVEKYIDKHPEKDINQLFEQDYFPHSGPHMVKELADMNIPNLVSSVLPFYLYYCFSIGPVNPLVYFIDNNGSIETRIENKRTVPYDHRKNLIIDPKDEDIRAKRFL